MVDDDETVFDRGRRPDRQFDPWERQEYREWRPTLGKLVQNHKFRKQLWSFLTRTLGYLIPTIVAVYAIRGLISRVVQAVMGGP
jgi:hypothetical protein